MPKVNEKEKVKTAKKTMGAPRNVGRPRTSVPEKDELIKLGEDLVKWATEPTEELRFQYSQWYTPKGYLQKDWDHMLQKEEFRVYYEQARMGIAKRYVDGSINPSIAQRFLRIYFPALKEDENEKMAYESSLKREETQTLNEADILRFQQMMDLIKDKQN